MSTTTLIADLSTGRAVDSFPSVSLPSYSGGLPVEVALIAQLGIGAGDALIRDAERRQRGHPAFVDALDEPSVRLGGMDLPRGDASSLYTFVVGAGGHPFHRHAGNRVFTAVSGSSGVRLRFSTASQAQIELDPAHFMRALRQVDIPPDCLFTVRFGGGTWHQFLPLRGSTGHPALFALSCHTNELGGDLPDALREQVLANGADIPSLTELLPPALHALLSQSDPARIRTVALSLHAPPRSGVACACASVRRRLGRVRSAFAGLRAPRGYLASSGGVREVVQSRTLPAGSMLRDALADRYHYQDSFRLCIAADEAGSASASELMERLLAGFVENRPAGVSWLMAVRNVLVRPLGLRTSPLGCPASSLLCDAPQALFASRFPVLAQRRDRDDRRVQVVLGADDRHLVFRTCVGVDLCADGTAEFTLSTRVRNRNLFGHAYMAMIDRVHRRYIAPSMLRFAVDHALAAPLAKRQGACA